ncbi:hypothetical protein B0H11DRAFT_2230573 [Mycena galericulata]|nr:hypothetical protein B0H11DRAFT_2230573 [Mycena galericulata]
MPFCCRPAVTESDDGALMEAPEHPASSQLGMPAFFGSIFTCYYPPVARPARPSSGGALARSGAHELRLPLGAARSGRALTSRSGHTSFLPSPLLAPRPGSRAPTAGRAPGASCPPQAAHSAARAAGVRIHSACRRRARAERCASTPLGARPRFLRCPLLCPPRCAPQVSASSSPTSPPPPPPLRRWFLP